MAKPEARGNDPGMDSSKKRAAVSTKGEHPLRAAQSAVLNEMRRLEDIPVLLRQDSKNMGVEEEQPVIVWDVKDCAELPVGHWRASKIMYAGGYRTTVFRA